MSNEENEPKKEAVRFPAWFNIEKYRRLVTEYFDEISLEVDVQTYREERALYECTVCQEQVEYTDLGPSSLTHCDRPMKFVEKVKLDSSLTEPEFTSISEIEGNLQLNSAARYRCRLDGESVVDTVESPAFEFFRRRMDQIFIDSINIEDLPDDFEDYKAVSDAFTRQLQNYFVGDLLHNRISTVLLRVSQIAVFLQYDKKPGEYKLLFHEDLSNPQQYIEKHLAKRIPKERVLEFGRSVPWFNINRFEDDVLRFFHDINLHIEDPQEPGTFRRITLQTGDRIKHISKYPLISTASYRFRIYDDTDDSYEEIECKGSDPRFTNILFRIRDLVVQNIVSDKLPVEFEVFDDTRIRKRIAGQISTRFKGDMITNIFASWMSEINALYREKVKVNPDLDYKTLLDNPNPLRTLKEGT